ncbi:MAG TPA: Rieske 2Fe-2S domain-containing protein [Bryobacteraceae bacterium]|jgi:menaquinol-cytochrome c reductase iron-sulfur subunit
MLNPQITRRSFYVHAINLLGSLVAAAAAIPAIAYLLGRPKTRESAEWIGVADLSQLQIGQPEEIVYNRKRMDGWQRVDEKTSTWMVRTSSETVVAYSPACTHLGCAYHWEAGAQQFQCPCHGSVFAIDGKVLAGPAPRPLDRFLARVEDGKVLINPETSKESA